MSYDIKYSYGLGTQIATVGLICDTCRHRGEARYSWQKKSQFWWLGAHYVTNAKDGRPDFDIVPGKEFVNADNPHNTGGRLSDLSHCNKVIFEASTLRHPGDVGLTGWRHQRNRNAAAIFRLLRKTGRISEDRLARESGVSQRVLRAIASGQVAITTEILAAIKAALRNHEVSDVELSLLGDSSAFSDISRTDLATIERLLSDISGKLSSLVSGSPGTDLKAVINRLETANAHLSKIATNTQK